MHRDESCTDIARVVARLSEMASALDRPALITRSKSSMTLNASSGSPTSPQRGPRRLSSGASGPGQNLLSHSNRFPFMFGNGQGYSEETIVERVKLTSNFVYFNSIF
jgi:hypothetical protein